MRSGGQPEAELVARFGAVMGTVVSMHVCPGRLSGAALDATIEEAFASLAEADEMFSLWKPESPLNRLRAGLIDLASAPGDVVEVIRLCTHARQLSGGWFDPWAIDGPRASSNRYAFDPTGLVKGWAAERALAILTAAGAAGALVNAGGDIACAGRGPGGNRWRAGIRHPWRVDAFACAVALEQALATSGCYERGAHLMNPFDGSRATAASASVAGPSLTLADALATALSVGGTEVAQLIEQLDGYECYLIGPDGSEHSTAGFPFAAARPGELTGDAA
jgi:thiamine biosynthesis lipoprotein